MWRGLGWLFVNNWSPADANKLYLSGLVQTRDVGSARLFRRREVWIEEGTDLDALRKAATFVTDAQMRARYRHAAENLPAEKDDK